MAPGANAWPLHESAFGVIFGPDNKSYHTRYSAVAFDGLGTNYQQTSFTDMFVVSVGSTGVQLSTYLQNGDGGAQYFDTTFLVLITRIGDQLP